MAVATVPVTDLARAKAFYGETLGLAILWENRSASASAVDIAAKSRATAPSDRHSWVVPVVGDQHLGIQEGARHLASRRGHLVDQVVLAGSRP